MDLKTLLSLFKTHKETQLFGRYIHAGHIASLLKIYGKKFHIETIGSSVLGEPIHAITIGTGQKKILMWSQMHGNESTCTKAVFDLCKTFTDSKISELTSILDRCTIAIIPILNPDGAKSYSRLNANGIDLNRDAQELSQPESIALRTFFEKFKPHFCFNLHDQRTVYSAGNCNRPATISFLAPAQDMDCTITEARKKSMEIILKMHENLQRQIPGQIGIYDDAFNLNCVGDTFQSLEIPTILFEAGHYANDYDREVVREFLFQSLLVALDYIASVEVSGRHFADYTQIPQNEKRYYDVIVRNAMVNHKLVDMAIQYKESLKNGTVTFVPMVENMTNLREFFGHKEVDANHQKIMTFDGLEIYEGYENDFALLNNEIFSFKP